MTLWWQVKNTEVLLKMGFGDLAAEVKKYVLGLQMSVGDLVVVTEPIFQVIVLLLFCLSGHCFVCVDLFTTH